MGALFDRDYQFVPTLEQEQGLQKIKCSLTSTYHIHIIANGQKESQ
jgi:hypothetical protein